MTELRHSLILARLDVTCTVRKHLDRTQLPALVLFVIMVGAGTLGGGYLSHRAGMELRPGGAFGEFPVVFALRGVVALLWLVIAAIFVVRAFGSRGDADTTGGLLASVRTRTAVAGILLAEVAYALLWLGLPVLGLGAGFALGTGVYYPLLTVPLAAIGFATSSVAVGYPVGIALRHVVTRYEFVARHKNTLIVLFAAGYVVAFASGSINDLFVQLFEPAESSPMAWFGDLVLLGAPEVSPSPTNAMLALLGTVLVGTASLPVTTRLAVRHWFSDPVSLGPDERVPGLSVEETGRFERGLEQALDRPTAALVLLAYRRTIRAPFKLLYAAIPLFMLIGFLPDIVERGEIPGFLVVVILGTIVWGGGMLFVLNPLGDQGNVLPATVLSTTSGRQFVRAHVIASLLVTLPVGVLVTAGAAMFSPLDTGTGVVLVLASPVVIALGSVLAVGLGVAFPRFSAIQVTQSTEAVVPSKAAFVTYSLYLAVTALAGGIVYEETIGELTAAVLSWLLPFGLSAGTTTLYYGSGIALVGVLLAPFFAYRYAVRRVDGYTLN